MIFPQLSTGYVKFRIYPLVITRILENVAEDGVGEKEVEVETQMKMKKPDPLILYLLWFKTRQRCHPFFSKVFNLLLNSFFELFLSFYT